MIRNALACLCGERWENWHQKHDAYIRAKWNEKHSGNGHEHLTILTYTMRPKKSKQLDMFEKPPLKDMLAHSESEFSDLCRRARAGEFTINSIEVGKGDVLWIFKVRHTTTVHAGGAALALSATP